MGCALILKNKKLLLDVCLPSRIEAITELSLKVQEALSSRPDLAFSANLCLDELITKTTNYGLKGDTDRFIRVRLSISDNWLEIIIKDDAPAFDPFCDAPAPDLDAELEDRPIGGLSVHLVKTMMDDVRAYFDGSGNLIALLKAVNDPAPAP